MPLIASITRTENDVMMQSSDYVELGMFLRRKDSNPLAGGFLHYHRAKYLTVSTCYVKVGTKLAGAGIFCYLLSQITDSRSF